VVVAQAPYPEPKKKTPIQRRAPRPKELQTRKNKRSPDSQQLVDGTGPNTTVKQLRLSLLDNLCQDEASNSNSDLSRLSPTIENESLKETLNQKVGVATLFLSLL
jgi:hypothetical protein